MSKKNEKPEKKTEISDQDLDKVQGAGDRGDYTGDLEDIRVGLDSADGSGSQLGTMVGAQLKMVEAETTYQVKGGVPTKVSKASRPASAPIRRPNR